MTGKEMKPNIVLFSSHDSGTEFGCYGSPTDTPQIDALAEKGVKFTNNFCTAPQCSPSRGSILTGMHPHQHGLMGLVNYGWNLPKENITLPNLAKKAGYSTNLIGLQHEHKDAAALGYERVSDRMDFPYLSDFVIPKAEDFFEGIKVQNKPFFVSIGIFEAHRPFPHYEEDDEISNLPRYLPEHPEIAEEYTRFSKGVKKVDEAVGRVQSALETNRLTEETLFIFTVDHGPAFPRVKCTAYDPGIHTALIFSWIGRLREGLEIDALVNNVDLFPTLAKIMRVDIPNNISGKSLLPLLEEEENIVCHRHQVFAELTYHDIGYNPIRAIRTERYKYVRNFAPLPFKFEIPDDFIDSGATKAYLEIYGEERYNQPREEEELYDLTVDPLEMNNVASVADHAKIKSDLAARLLDWLQKTKDPVLEGKMNAPEGPGPFVF